MRAAATFILMVMLGLGARQEAWAQTQPFRLQPADSIASRTYLIVTVPLAEPTALAATAAAIEARFHLRLAAEWPLRSIAVHCFVMDASGGGNIDALIARMHNDTQIRTVQRMQQFGTYESRPSDPFFPIQTALKQLNVPAAQRISTGSGVRVGVVDSAIDGAHPDLAGRVAELHDFVGDDSHRVAEAHGTAMAGTIAANASNAIGIVGVAPSAELIGLRACWQASGQAGRCSSFSLARALNFAILDHVAVLNLSLGGPPDPLLEELVQTAIKNGIVVVAASGEGTTPGFPASIPGVIAAGGSADPAVPAPSIDVISTAPGNHYRYVSGSSVAAANVTGVVALLLAAHASLKAEEIARALHAAVTVRGNQTPMLDACQALRSVVQTTFSCS